MAKANLMEELSHLMVGGKVWERPKLSSKALALHKQKVLERLL